MSRIVYCRSCGQECPAIPEIDAAHPDGYECGKCWRSRHSKDDDDDNDLPDTDVLEGDDPDQYLGIPD